MVLLRRKHGHKKRLRLVLPSVVLKFWWQLAKQYQFTKLGIFWFPTFLQNWGKYIYSWCHWGFSQHKTRWQDGIIIRIIWFDSIVLCECSHVPSSTIIRVLGAFPRPDYTIGTYKLGILTKDMVQSYMWSRNETQVGLIWIFVYVLAAQTSAGQAGPKFKIVSQLAGFHFSITCKNGPYL